DVSDTGVGIDEDVLPLIFNEFFQAHGDLTRRHGGSGLGLAISQRLAHVMGAEITVRSEAGRGSTFTRALRPAAEGSERRPSAVLRHRERMAARAEPGPEPVSVVAFGRDAAALTELERRVRPGVRLRWTTDEGAVAALAAE